MGKDNSTGLRNMPLTVGIDISPSCSPPLSFGWQPVWLCTAEVRLIHRGWVLLQLQHQTVLQMLDPCSPRVWSLLTQGCSLPAALPAHTAAASKETVSVVSLLPLLESGEKDILWQGRRNWVEAEEGESIWGEQGYMAGAASRKRAHWKDGVGKGDKNKIGLVGVDNRERKRRRCVWGGRQAVENVKGKSRRKAEAGLKAGQGESDLRW